MVRFLPQDLPQTPNMRVDFSPLSQLGDQIGAQRREGERRSTLADLGKEFAAGNYKGAAERAFEGGLPGLGLQAIQEDFRRQQAQQPAQHKPTALMQNLIAAGIQPGSPEFQKAILGSINRPGTQVTVNNAGETAFAKERGKFQAQRFQKIQDAGDLASSSLNKVTQIDEVLNNPDINTGTLGPMSQTVKKALGTVFGADVSGVGEGELLQRLSTDLTLDDTSRLKGSIQVREFEAIKKMQPSLSNSLEGNKLLAKMKRLELEHAVSEAQLFEQHGGRPPRAQLSNLRKNTSESVRGVIREMREVKTKQPLPTAGIRSLSDDDLKSRLDQLSNGQ